MILKTKEFQEAANKILVAVNLDHSAANLELVVTFNLSMLSTAFIICYTYCISVMSMFTIIS